MSKDNRKAFKYERLFDTYYYLQPIVSYKNPTIICVSGDTKYQLIVDNTAKLPNDAELISREEFDNIQGIMETNTKKIIDAYNKKSLTNFTGFESHGYQSIKRLMNLNTIMGDGKKLHICYNLTYNAETVKYTISELDVEEMIVTPDSIVVPRIDYGLACSKSEHIGGYDIYNNPFSYEYNLVINDSLGEITFIDEKEYYKLKEFVLNYREILK